MANEIVIEVKDDNDVNLDPINTALQKIGDTARRTTDETTKGFDRARDSLGRFVRQGEGVTRTTDGIGNSARRASGVLDAFVGKTVKGFAGGAESVFKFGQRISEAGFQIAAAEAAGTAASGGLNMVMQAAMGLAIATPAAAGGFILLAPALLSVAGVAGAAATALTGLGLTLATLAIGFGGIGTALSAHSKQMAGAGKAAVDTSEQQHQAAIRIRDASRAVVDAKERERDAAKDVAKAIQEEIERREDLAIQLGLQKVSVSEAEQAVVEAKEKNRRAQEAGSDWEKAEAKNALARAEAELASQKEKLGDLTKEKEKAAKTGVQGSDLVQAALERESAAHEQVIRAQERLTEAKRKQTVATVGATGAVNAFDEAMKKLSPNAQKLVLALIEIGKRFDKIKRQVQDRLLAGFDKEVTELADKWLPHLDDILGNIADHLNSFGKKTMQALGDSEFIENIEGVGETFGKVIDDISDSVTAFIDAFGRIADAASPVLLVISGTLRKIFEWFDRWIKRADDTGQLDSFMEKAADMLQKIFDIGQKVFEIVGKIIAIVFPSSEDTANSVFDSINSALDKVSDWLANPSNQKKVEKFVDTVADFLKWLFKTGLPIVGRIIKYELDMANAWGTVARAVGKVADKVSDVLKYIYSHVADFLNWIQKNAFKVGANLANMWDGLKNGFRNALNWVIEKWNNLSFRLPAILGGGSIDTPDIGYFAKGGVAGGLIMAGERGRELIRVPQGSSVIPHGQTEQMMGSGGGGDWTLALAPNGNKLMDAIIEGMRLYVHSRGGQVQVALGRGKVKI